MANKIRIKQIASPIRRHRRQRETLIGLGLNRIGRAVVRADTPAIRGMIAKVHHLVQVLSEAIVESKAENPKLSFNEGLACDAIIRHLESVEGGTRSDLRWPEKQNHASPVEVIFNIGSKLYALEHTGIEPFEGHVGMTAQATRLFDPIRTALTGRLDETAMFELVIPVNALKPYKGKKLESIQNALVTWVEATGPNLPHADRPYTGKGTGPISDAPGIPFSVRLTRYEPPIVAGQHFEIRHELATGEQARAERMKRAINKKFPKLANWKRSDGAKTILILEQNDVQLTNASIVTETYVPLVQASVDCPDETYLVVSCMQPWLVYPILVGGKSYFDLARAPRQVPVYWEVDPADLHAVTDR